MTDFRGILFSRSMVTELRLGRKTQTRRAVPWRWEGCISGDCPHTYEPDCCAELVKHCRYGQAGDILFAKETVIPSSRSGGRGVMYAENYPEDKLSELGKKHGGWKPSIFTTSAEARFWYRIAALRVERLRRMPEADAWAEGVHTLAEYSALWDAINGEPKLITGLHDEPFYLSQPWAGQDENRVHRKRTWYVRPNPFVYVLTLERLIERPTIHTPLPKGLTAK